MLCLSRLSLLVSRTLDCLALFFSSVSRHLFLIVSLIPYFICCFYCLFFFSFLLFFFFFFFFSSRRRHTRSLCDWSSDVCSSDLPRGSAEGAVGGHRDAPPSLPGAAADHGVRAPPRLRDGGRRPRHAGRQHRDRKSVV